MVYLQVIISHLFNIINYCLVLIIILLLGPPDQKSLRTLVLISKLLQSVSNGVEFDGSKEDYMRNLNPFIHRNRLHVAIFFDKLVVCLFYYISAS